MKATVMILGCMASERADVTAEHEGRTGEDAASSPLVVALVAPDYPPDPHGTGIGTYSKHLAEGLAARGHRVHVVTRGNGEGSDPASGAVTIHRIEVERPQIPLNLSWPRVLAVTIASSLKEVRYRVAVARMLRRLVEHEGVMVVEAADAQADAYLYRNRDHPTVPYIVRLHAPLSFGELYDRNLPEVGRRILRMLERQHILGATHLTVPTRRAGTQIRREMGLGHRPIREVANPPPAHIQAEMLHDPVEAEREDGLVLFLGRVTRLKGVHVLVDAIPRVLEADPGSRFLFVGPDTATASGHDSTFEHIRSSIPARHRERLEFTGHVALDDVGSYYRRAAVCVFPSLFETFSYTCLEAMAHGCAIVGSWSGGMADLLDGGRVGRLYRPPDAADLADQIVGLLRDPEERQRLGRAARDRARTQYGEDTVFRDIIAFYREAIRDLS